MKLNDFEIRDASRCALDALRLAMQDAFSDYAIPLQLDTAAFALMMRQRGLDVGASRIAVIDEQIVSIWLVSVRGDSAYLISSGTIPAFRSRGVSRALANHCITGLQERKVRTFQTEVLRNNAVASGLYGALGMQQSRLLDCYIIPAQPRRIERP